MEKFEQMKALISQLEALGQNVMLDEITSIKQKIADEKTKLKAEVPAGETAAGTFYEKYRVEIIVTAVLVILHVAGRSGF